MLSRRRLLVGGFVSVGALLAAGAWYEWSPDIPPPGRGFRFAQLGPEDRAVIAAIAPVMTGLRDSGPRVCRGVDVAMGGLPPLLRAQVRTLLGLLRFPPARIVLAGILQPWGQAGPAAIERFLVSWRGSPFVQLRSAYDALHQLILAAWYGAPESWPAIGYSGPPRVR